MTETQAGSAATVVYNGAGMASVKEFTASGLVEDALYAFKVSADLGLHTFVSFLMHKKQNVNHNGELLDGVRW